MKSLLHFLLALTVLGGTLQSSQAQTTKYVTPAGTGDGSSWTNASGDLQTMINAAASGDQVWVAAGTYYPTSGTDRSISFVMKNGVAIYGGFAGTESNLSQRNWKTNTTTLSGDIGTAGINTDNSYHVIFNYGNNLDPSARLDGFTITAGNANGSDINEGSGGGLSNVVSAPAVANCHFINNSASVFGGGIFNTASESSPVITNCSFTNNSVAFGGGGMCNMNGASPTITNCVFNGNLAQDGGGIFSNNAGNARITNCSFTNNTGGAIKNISSGGQPSIPVLTNCILWNNTGGQIIEGTAGSVAIATYCIVQDGYIGTGNLDADPLFVNTANGDLHLQAGSPATNSGLNSTNTLPTDLDGNPRIINGTIDRGAYETPAVCPPVGILYVKATAALGGDGTTWEHAFTKLQDALANACPDVSQIWVAKGTYYPDEGGGKTDNDLNASFIMKNNLAIYGGFAGTEAANFDLAQRNFVANPTILSGDIDKNNVLDDGNSYHVIFNNNNGLDAYAIIDGFTITAGKATYSDDNTRGAGMYNVASSPAISHCKFTNCYGVFGGALFLKNSSSTISNCSFINNNALYGAGILYEEGSPSIVNCSIVNNTGSFSPGGIFSGTNAASSITNCIVWGNSGAGQIAVGGLTVAPTVTNCLIQMGYYAGGTNILTTDPLFVNAANGDLHLQLASPAINAGLNTANTLSSDLDGNTRIVGGTIDIGAYESQAICPTGNILYVKADATGANNGSSWTDAYNSLQDALANTCPDVSQIWVAKGTYYPTTTSDRSISFVMKPGIAIYGGFAGTEQSNYNLAQRNFAANPSILSGDIGTPGDAADNSYHVVFNNNNGLTTTNALLDGFTITGSNGAVIGGGMLNSASSPTVSNCLFTGNQANNAGAMMNDNCSPTITNCSFTNNESIAEGGAMFNNNNANPVITNCIFAKNKAGTGGGAIINTYNSQPKLINCSIGNNSAGINDRGGIYNYFSSPTIANCIIWGNNNGQIADDATSQTTVSYSIVEGGFTGTANYNVNPKFVNAANGDLHLQLASPAINAGLNTANTLSSDLDGNTRIVGGTIDIGAYESQAICPTGNILYVKADATGANNGSSWTDAYNSLQDALANACVNVTQIWVAKGTYYPTTTTNRSISFVMKPGIAMYGGFAGTEAPNFDLTQRNFVANPSILSGDLQQNDEPGLTGAQLLTAPTRQDNSYHVIYNNNNGLGASAILDGFTITNGNGNGSNVLLDDIGAGMLNLASAPSITNCSFVKNSAGKVGGLSVLNYSFSTGIAITHCRFQDNYGNGSASDAGGAAGIKASSATVLFADCSFDNNSAKQGGGLYLQSGSVEITGCSFTNNTAPTGGGMYVKYATVTTTNCRFVNNTAAVAGGGLYSSGGSGTSSLTNCIFAKNKAGGTGAAISMSFDTEAINNITNCTIVNNVAQNGTGGIWTGDGSGGSLQLNISNTILWGNRGSITDQFINLPIAPVPTTISNSLVQGGYTGGTAIIDADPLLVDTAAGNLHLQACSPAIDAGTATGAPATDLDGNARPALGSFDIGAYEFTGTLPTALVLTCPPATTVYDCSLNGLASITKLAYATVPTSISQAALVAAGGSISGTCAVSNISYQDVIDAANSTPGNTLVNRTFTVTDIGSSTFTCTQVINLQEITIDASASSTPAALGSTATLSATVSPALAGVPVSFYLDNSLKGTSLTNASGVATLLVTGLDVDVYAVKAMVGQACTESYAYLSIYDPNGGFVTGAGWINSPEGALIASPLITGKANFGLNARYQKGKNIVDGDTEFKFKAGDFNFKSISNDAATLVISGAKATYRGVGTVNNAGSYGFLVVAVDADVNSSGPDRFRIKIWDKSQGNKVVYDNQLGKAENADDATELGGGAIVIHTANVKKSTSSSALSVQELTPNTEEALAIKVSNNPSTEGRNFRLQVVSSDKTTPVSLRVIDASGRPVQSWQHVAAGSILEAGSHWTKGMYIVEAIQDKKRVQVKLVKL